MSPLPPLGGRGGGQTISSSLDIEQKKQISQLESWNMYSKCLLCAKVCTVGIYALSHLTSNLQRRKERLREVEWVVQGHTAATTLKKSQREEWGDVTKAGIRFGGQGENVPGGMFWERKRLFSTLWGVLIGANALLTGEKAFIHVHMELTQSVV